MTVDSRETTTVECLAGNWVERMGPLLVGRTVVSTEFHSAVTMDLMKVGLTEPQSVGH